jgi:predicted permease
MSMRTMFADAFQDLRFGLRLLRRSPVFTTVAVSSLALGIGGAAAVFSLLNAIVLRNLPIAEPDRFFVAERHRSDEIVPRFSWPAAERLRDEMAGRAELAAASPVATMQLRPARASATAAAERGSVQLVSGEYFDVVLQRRQPPLAGRLLTRDDNRVLDGHPVAVISEGYWRRSLAAAADAIGQTLAINGTPFTIVGIAAPEFSGTNVSIRGVDAWVPLLMQASIRYGGNASSNNSGDMRKPWPPQEDVAWLNLFARVPRGTEAASIAAALTVRHHADVSSRSGVDTDYAERLRAERIVLAPAGRGLSALRGQASTTLYVLLAMMIVLLLIASGNVASLLVARATSRQREIAVRLSLGAGRLRLVRQLLVESMLLGLAGGAVGLGLAVWGRDLLLRLFVSGQTPVITLDTGIDWRVMAFATAISLLTGLTCGMLPAFRVTRVPVSESLKLQSRAAGMQSRRTLLASRALLAAQMAFCLLLLVVAGLFVRSLRVLSTSEIGFDRHQVLGARVDVRSLGLSADQRQVLYRRLLDRVQALPGVQSASLSQNGPVITSSQISGFSVEGHTPRPGERMSTNEEIVTEDYFATVGLRIVRGRSFGPADRAEGSRSTLINETMARRFFSGQDPIGKRWAYDVNAVSTSDAFVIVGVVEDAKYRDLRSAVPTMTYHLSGPSEDAILGDLEVRTAGTAEALVAAVRQALAEAEPRLPVYDILPMEQRVARSLAQDTVIAQLTSVFSGISLLLACLGLYGTISYGVNQRVAELGLRIALGADRRQVLWLVMREAVGLVAIGSVIGFSLAYLAARSLSSVLYGIGPVDPLAYGAAGVLLLGVGLVAAYLPAFRASRIEPMRAIAGA